MTILKTTEHFKYVNCIVFALHLNKAIKGSKRGAGIGGGSRNSNYRKMCSKIQGSKLRKIFKGNSGNNKFNTREKQKEANARTDLNRSPWIREDSSPPSSELSYLLLLLDKSGSCFQVGL